MVQTFLCDIRQLDTPCVVVPPVYNAEKTIVTVNNKHNKVKHCDENGDYDIGGSGRIKFMNNAILPMNYLQRQVHNLVHNVTSASASSGNTMMFRMTQTVSSIEPNHLFSVDDGIGP